MCFRKSLLDLLSSIVFDFISGYSRRPRSAAAFVLSAIWWSFSIIFLATYIMGMVSTQARTMFSVPGLKIRTLSDILEQTETSIGCIAGGSTMTLFKTSRIPVYEKTWERMRGTYPEKGLSPFVKSTKEAIQRVAKGKYAWLGESSIIDYVVIIMTLLCV
jgi:ionotropic kainate glutamate receptor 2